MDEVLKFFTSHFAHEEVEAQPSEPQPDPQDTSLADGGAVTDPFNDQIENSKLSDDEENLLLDEMSKLLDGLQLNEEVDLSVSLTGWTIRGCALACLRARKYNSQRATQLYRAFTAKRRELQLRGCGGINAFTNRPLADFLSEEFILLLGATDRRGRPILLFKLSNYDPSAYSALEVVQLLSYVVEKVLRAPGSLADAAQLNGVCIVQDWDAAGLSNIDFKLPQAVFQVFGQKTPLRVGVILILNISGVFRMALSVGLPFLNAKLQRRIILINDAADDLPNYLPISSTPTEYGGSLNHSHADWVRDNIAVDKETFERADVAVD